MSAPRISILLPTWNGEGDLERLLPALAKQSRAHETELLCIDSSSSDRSVELLRAAGAEVEVIPQADFGHGKTRNALAARARGELLVFLSQDALPANEEFLAELVRPFEEPRVAGSYARILPHASDDPLTARTVLDSPEAGVEPITREFDERGPVWDLPARERAEYLRFNNVASAVRASIFREIDFPDLPFGEDFAWAARALNAGWAIQFAPEAVAYHAHSYSPREAFERYRVDAAFHREIHGYALRPSLVSVARGFLYELREDFRFLKARGASGGMTRHLLRAPGLRGAQVLGQYWGSRGWGPHFWPQEVNSSKEQLGGSGSSR
jgi:GT2 family glycosyltransferase